MLFPHPALAQLVFFLTYFTRPSFILTKFFYVTVINLEVFLDSSKISLLFFLSDSLQSLICKTHILNEKSEDNGPVVYLRNFSSTN